MQHIDLSYQWTLPGYETARNRHSPLRNPLMDLLEAVRQAGSIAAAAKSLNLSYRHVWGELKRWEQSLGQPLIVWEKVWYCHSPWPPYAIERPIPPQVRP
jgi:putative molybdopterin biosynthesis protein